MGKVLMEPFEVLCVTFRRFLPFGETPDGGFRDEAMLQFYTDPGGMRTVAKRHIVRVR